MKDQVSSSESGVMKAAASAATKVSNWSASKQEFASRVTNNGSFAIRLRAETAVLITTLFGKAKPLNCGR